MVELAPVDVVERDAQMGALPVDPAEPEILAPVERRAVLLQVLGDAPEHLLGPKV